MPLGLLCLLVVVTLLGLLGTPGNAAASWAVGGTGSAAGAAAVMPTGATPSAAASGTSVGVSWPVATFANGAAVAGYRVSRYNTSTGLPVTVGAGCSGVVTLTSCTELAVTAGTWAYTVTPLEVNWAGGQSPESPPVVLR